jgi:hypothetical protein
VRGEEQAGRCQRDSGTRLKQQLATHAPACALRRILRVLRVLRMKSVMQRQMQVGARVTA